MKIIATQNNYWDMPFEVKCVPKGNANQLTIQNLGGVGVQRTLPITCMCVAKFQIQTVRDTNSVHYFWTSKF